MENRGLLFIPDISGFTRFVNETEIQHSRLIIQELLEVLINANQLGLEVSEIEGDAILFYRFGDSPDVEALYKQVEKMFHSFHRHLVAYEYRKFCQCEACQSAIDLSLKVITHFGEFTGYTVKNFSKLIGRDIIVAHQLLKNDIAQHEYWLVTDSVLSGNAPVIMKEWMKWDTSAKETESGKINFHYTQLGELKKEIPAESMLPLDLSKKTKLISVSREYETGIIPLFHATGDFNYRSRWRVGVKAVEEMNHALPRIGMQCSCLLENGETILYSSSYSYQPDRIEFSETDEGNGDVTYYTLEKKERLTRLTVDYYMNRNWIGRFLFGLHGRKKMEAELHHSLDRLEGLLKEINSSINNRNA